MIYDNKLLLIFIYVFITRDSLSNEAQYEAVSVIEYKGNVTSTGYSVGHYICDVKDRSSGKWFRTNDNDDPIQIQEEDVSKSAYVVLYKRLG